MASEASSRGPLLERSSASPKLEDSAKTSKKRKRGALDQAAKKAAEKRNAKKGTTAENEETDIEAGINKGFAQMTNQLLADYIAQRTRRYESDLSSVELEDKYLPATAIEDTTSWSHPRTIDNLPGFLEKFAGNDTKLWSASKKNGAPHTIIIAAAGLRAADLARSVRKFQTKDATIAKLFAKHIKIQDSIKFLKSRRTGIAVGTPTRLRDLMENGALNTDRLERIVVDASHTDQKNRGILEMKDTHVPLIAWLGQKPFRERYGLGKEGIQLLFY